jgi:uncharacterized membrane protein
VSRACKTVSPTLAPFFRGGWSVYVHIVWFGVWMLLNTGRAGMRPFDPCPSGLLTMVVSLEAIFLSTFVLISQHRLSAAAEHRADLDVHIGLLTE